MSDGPIAQEHHEDDDADVDGGADDVFDDIVIALAIDGDLDGCVGDQGHNLIDEGHRVEDKVQLAEAVGVAYEPDDPDEGH